MDNSFTYITIHQGFALIAGIEDCKRNPHFDDNIAENFVKEVKKQSVKITVNSLNSKTNLLQKLKRNGNKIKILTSELTHVIALTGINVLDEEIMKQHMTKLNEVEPITQNNKQKTR